MKLVSFDGASEQIGGCWNGSKEGPHLRPSPFSSAGLTLIHTHTHAHILILIIYKAGTCHQTNISSHSILTPHSTLHHEAFVHRGQRCCRCCVSLARREVGVDVLQLTPLSFNTLYSGAVLTQAAPLPVTHVQGRGFAGHGGTSTMAGQLDRRSTIGGLDAMRSAIGGVDDMALGVGKLADDADCEHLLPV